VISPALDHAPTAGLRDSPVTGPVVKDAPEQMICLSETRTILAADIAKYSALEIPGAEIRFTLRDRAWPRAQRASPASRAPWSWVLRRIGSLAC